MMTTITTLLKTIINKNTDEKFDAKKAFSVAKYGKEVTSSQIYQSWLKDVEAEIKYQSQIRSYSYILNIPEDKEKYLTEFILFFEKKGFNMNLISKDTLENYSGKSKFLLITWDNIALD